MGIVNITDLSLVYTGGSNNNDPDLSLGGSPSNYPLTSNINNLFDNVDEATASSGNVDYRCIYIFNNNVADTFYNLRIYIEYVTGDESQIQFGITKITEVQNININNTTGGSFDVSYKPPNQSTTETRTVVYDSDPATWAANIQSQIRSIPTLDGISVSVSGNFTNRIFNITFDGNDYRSHDLLTVDGTNLTGSSPTISVSRSVTGSPINSVPVSLDVSTTPPSGVTFYDSSAIATIGNLYPEEGFPLWFKRTVFQNSSPVSGEGFKLKIIANPVQV